LEMPRQIIGEGEDRISRKNSMGKNARSEPVSKKAVKLGK